MSRHIFYNQLDELKKLLVGKSVKKVDEERLLLSDGTKVQVVGNADCCAYYDLKHLGEVENIITNVEVFEDPNGDYYDKPFDEPGVYRLFVFTGEEKINLAEFEGTDSNGYYGTGFWLEVIDEVKP